MAITCPPYFDFAQRTALANAAQIAGVNLLETVSDPAAAAIGYGVRTESDQVVLIYELGSLSYSISVAEIKSGSITITAYTGEPWNGGRDWDEAFVRYLAHEWMLATGSPSDPLDSLETLQELWVRAEAAKHALSVRDETKVSLTHDGRTVVIKVTRSQFEALTSPLLERTISAAREACAAAGSPEVDQIFLVGGATRMPQVKTRLEREFGTVPHMFEPEQVIAKGAALYARKLFIGKYEQGAADAVPADSPFGRLAPQSTTGVTSGSIFISYNRAERHTVAALAEELGQRGYRVWFDQMLVGGQVWWDEILQQIRAADVFLFMLTSPALESVACQREYRYAHALGKRILPVLIADGVDMHLLPEPLQMLQAVAYCAQDADAWQRLLQALRDLPPPVSAPSPLPPAPPAPISPLGAIQESLLAPTLTPEQQSWNLVQLKELLKHEATAEGARTLLKQLLQHPDLRAIVANEARTLVE